MAAGTTRIVIWDWAVRLVHWLAVLLVPALWWTAEQGWMDWHQRLGLTLFCLIVFRLFWGFFGSWTARFLPMIRRLGALPAYVRSAFAGRDHATFGHNPLGVLSVAALLLALCAQLGTGLFSVDVDGLESGPLAILVSFDLGRQIAELHELNFNIVVALVGLHIAAIAFYQFRLRDNLVGPMVTGRRAREDFASDDPLPEVRARPVALIASGLLTAACLYAVLNAG